MIFLLYVFSFIYFELQSQILSSRQSLVSDINKYNNTVRAIRTDHTLKGCIGDGLHLSEPYRSKSAGIGPDYADDLILYCCRVGWKDLFSVEDQT